MCVLQDACSLWVATSKAWATEPRLLVSKPGFLDWLRGWVGGGGGYEILNHPKDPQVLEAPENKTADNFATSMAQSPMEVLSVMVPTTYFRQQSRRRQPT